MIERKAFLQIAKALVVGLRKGLTDPSAGIKQTIIVELADILRVERCVIFRIAREEFNGAERDICQIVAGVPLEEYGLDVRLKASLDDHPDIKAAVGNGRMLVIRDPQNDLRTAYFKGIVERKDLSETPIFRSLSKKRAAPQA